MPYSLWCGCAADGICAFLLCESVARVVLSGWCWNGARSCTVRVLGYFGASEQTTGGGPIVAPPQNNEHVEMPRERAHGRRVIAFFVADWPFVRVWNPGPFSLLPSDNERKCSYSWRLVCYSERSLGSHYPSRMSTTGKGRLPDPFRERTFLKILVTIMKLLSSLHS